MPENKRQHFLPRMILRHFSIDGAGREIALQQIPGGERVARAPLKSQCYQDYFYGQSGRLEQWLGQLESTFARVIRDPSREALDDLSDDDTDTVLSFAGVQKFRTEQAALKGVRARRSLLEGLAPELQLTRAHQEQILTQCPPTQLENLAILQANEPFWRDLKVKFLFAPKGTGFVISDDPVAVQNHWAEHHPDLSSSTHGTGLASCGLQWFFPISPALCVGVFDPGTYQYGPNQGHTCRISRRDVRLLNAIQVLNANELFFYDAGITKVCELDRLHTIRKTTKRSFVPRAFGVPGQYISKLPIELIPDVRLGKQLSFVRVIDKTRQPNRNSLLPTRQDRFLQALCA